MGRPPRVPEVWVWSTLVLKIGNIPIDDFCTRLQTSFLQVGLECTRQSDWLWSLEGCFHLHYITAECHIFEEDSKFIIDIQHLSGDRMTWFKRIKNPILSLWNTGQLLTIPPSPKNSNTPKSAYAFLKVFPLEGLACMAKDADPKHIEPLLKSKSPNIVRCAMKTLAHCDSLPEDWSVIETWLSKTPQNLLDRETIHWAHVLRRNIYIAME